VAIVRRVVSSQEDEVRSEEVMTWLVLVVVMRVGLNGLRAGCAGSGKIEADLGRCYRAASPSVAGAMGPSRSLFLAAVWLWVQAPCKGITLIFQAHGGESGVWAFSDGSFWG
jgi:hypothetical protein